MKVTLDLDRLLQDGLITREEYEWLNALGEKATSSLAFNILIGFGVVAVSTGMLALVPAASTAVVIGLCVLMTGLVLQRDELGNWTVLASICVLAGALMIGGGILVNALGSGGSFILVATLFAVTAVIAKSALLAVLSILVLSGSLGASTGYFHASYFLVIQEPTLTIGMFSVIAIALYLLSRKLPSGYERIAIAAGRTAVFLVNLGFWIGSLWGDQSRATGQILIEDNLFAIAWAAALLAAGVWAWMRNRRWVLNTVASFGGIHFYTQWFENLGATPGTVVIAGLITLAFALALRNLNLRMRESV